MEAADAGVALVVAITEGIPTIDMMKALTFLEGKPARASLVPTVPGLISAEIGKAGIIPGHICKRGRVGIVSKSGTLTYEAIHQLTRLGLGQTSCIGIGGDPLIGTSFIDALALFAADSETEAVVMIGEIGGNAEQDAADWIRTNFKKPVVGFIAGQTAPPGPPHGPRGRHHRRRQGHGRREDGGPGQGRRHRRQEPRGSGPAVKDRFGVRVRSSFQLRAIPDPQSCLPPRLGRRAPLPSQAPSRCRNILYLTAVFEGEPPVHEDQSSMAFPDVLAEAGQSAAASSAVVNDFSIQVATVNGSGSQTANLVLIRSIFQMGVPVSGKNLFPSNIAGLPTWYTIRANKNGYIGRKKEIDFLVAMNPETAKEDVLTLEPGAAVVYDEPLALKTLRDDVVFYPVPFDKLVAEVTTDAKLRRLVRNMIYDGILSFLLEIEMGEMKKALDKQLGRKPKAMALNGTALDRGYAYAEATFERQHPYRIARTDQTVGKVLVEGNAAAALGCLMAGVTVVSWYPITPSSSLCETLIDYLRKYRMDPETGQATFAVVQAEDEIAALGMVVGASWAGARAMTSTAGPGISLMAEFTGLAYYAEIPAVIFDIQRVGPSTGLPTRTSQQDIAFAAGLSHGDARHLLLLPSSVGECYEMAMDAFDLAERFQTPVFVMSDLDLGMNMWMSDPFPYRDAPVDRGKVLDAETLKAIGEWGRYRDVDGDGIPYRTLPGSGMPAYFTRGTGHNEKAQYSERPDDFVRNLDRLGRKFDTARDRVPGPIVEANPKARVGIIAYGTSHWAIVESRDQLAQEGGLETAYLRLRAYPFSSEIARFIDGCDRVYIVEQNRDAQIAGLLRQELDASQIAKLRKVLHYNGLPMDARSVTDDILSQEGLITGHGEDAGSGAVGGE